MKIKKDGESYIYSSTELSKYYGISVKGMAFYEEKGLICPERIGHGQTRQFGLPDCYRLASARMLHNCGFSLDETAYLLETRQTLRFCDSLSKREQKIEEAIRLQQGILSGVRRLREMTECVQRGDIAPTVTMMPRFRRLFIRLFDEAHTSSADETGEFARWNSLMPITEASLRFSLRELFSTGERIHTEIGMIVSQEDFLRFGLEESDRVSDFPERKAVHGFLHTDERELDQKKMLREILDFAERKKLVPCGDAVTRLIFVFREGQRDIRWDEVWLPVK